MSSTQGSQSMISVTLATSGAAAPAAAPDAEASGAVAAALTTQPASAASRSSTSARPPRPRRPRWTRGAAVASPHMPRLRFAEGLWEGLWEGVALIAVLSRRRSRRSMVWMRDSAAGGIVVPPVEAAFYGDRGAVRGQPQKSDDQHGGEGLGGGQPRVGVRRRGAALAAARRGPHADRRRLADGAGDRPRPTPRAVVRVRSAASRGHLCADRLLPHGGDRARGLPGDRPPTPAAVALGGRPALGRVLARAGAGGPPLPRGGSADRRHAQPRRSRRGRMDRHRSRPRLPGAERQRAAGHRPCLLYT